MREYSTISDQCQVKLCKEAVKIMILRQTKSKDTALIAMSFKVIYIFLILYVLTEPVAFPGIENHQDHAHGPGYGI